VAKRISELPPQYLVALGPILSLAESAVDTIISPESIYISRFGEEDHSVHFHIYPRTSGVTREYLKIYPEQEELIHGPALFDWARSYYRCTKQEALNSTSGVIGRFREYMDTRR